MKKLFFALLAVVAIAFSGCKPPYSFLLENNYSKNAIVLFSENGDCRSIDTAKDHILAEPGKTYGGNFDLKGMYAIVYVCDKEKETVDGTLQGYSFRDTINLGNYAGYTLVTLTIDGRGMPGIEGDSF